MESAGLKEWAIVCEAMGRGEQSIILRKGGLAEGQAGFEFRYPEFFLFPTFFHEQIVKVRGEGADLPQARKGEIEIRFFAKVITVMRVTSWDRTVAALEALHILQPSVVRERFDYDSAPGLHVALVRVFRLAPRWIFPDASSYGGCRSWVRLPECPRETRFEPVLTDRDHEERVTRFRAACSL